MQSSCQQSEPRWLKVLSAGGRWRASCDRRENDSEMRLGSEGTLLGQGSARLGGKRALLGLLELGERVREVSLELRHELLVVLTVDHH